VAIQASAGTGKTYALAALATRYIVEEGISASELLIVTFTRAATNELRAKVRERLVAAARHLAHPPPGPSGDELLDHLAGLGSALHLERLERAITDFDAATVTTIHGFATQVLGALGVSVGTDPDAQFDPDTELLVAETCADVLVRAAMDGTPVDCLPSLEALGRAVRKADGHPDLALVPVPGQPGATPAQQIFTELVERSVRAVADRRLRAGTLSFDDVLLRLRDALCGNGPGAAGAVDGLRSRYKVALIDEFQDTDSVQWDILSTLFDSPDAATALVLVGDPKQAIYGFRGADIHTYLKAVGDGARVDRRSLTVNWRSDGPVLTSLAALFNGATFGDVGIPFVAVDPAPGHRDRRLTGAQGEPLPSLSLRLAIDGGIDRHKRAPHLVRREPAERAVAADLARSVVELLDTGRLRDEGAEGGWRGVRPPDIAVLVGRHDEGATMQAALAARGVPAVVARGGSVLQSPAADQLRWLVEALSHPSDPARARTFALSWFVGRRADEVAALSDGELADLQERLRHWSEMLGEHSVVDVLAQIWTHSGVVARVLRGPDGDRNMTDLDHLAELLQGAGAHGRSGPAGLLAVLDAKPVEDNDTEFDGDVSARRIASEADAVQIMTVWTAKGLEFPIVCVPTQWRAPGHVDVVYMDPTTGDRTLDLTDGKDWPDETGGAARRALARAEADGERLRLLYVALTRARHQTIVWWANADSGATALARVLFARTDGRIDDHLYAQPSVPVPSDDRIEAALAPLAHASEGTIVVEAVDPAADDVRQWSGSLPEAPPAPLVVAPLGPVPDRSKQRWSFSAIVTGSGTDAFDPGDPSLSDSGAADELGRPGSEPDDDPLEPAAGAQPDGAANRAGRAVTASPLADLPAGTAFGTLVHSVLEEVDFAATDLTDQIDAAIGRQLAGSSLDLTPIVPVAPPPGVPTPPATEGDGRRRLIEGLATAIGTPLGDLCGGVRLADIGLGDRLTEMSFDLRLAGAGPATGIRQIGRSVLDHLDAHDALRPWAAGLAEAPGGASLAGHLTGSIDLIMRVTGPSGQPRFVVADYKTNALHPRGMAVRAGDYGPPRLVEAMSEHDYPLQALLYSVALHRYLRWRLRGYDPAVHLGGAAYLFLRGMVGPGAGPAGSGVYEWALPPGLVVEVSDRLDGRPVADQPVGDPRRGDQPFEGQAVQASLW
jgi:exodeoxyribonuclease V beta subunit